MPKEIQFPSPSNINVNMMPIIMGEAKSVPIELHSYLPLIQQCAFKFGDTVYLSVTEKYVKTGEYSRRPGIHTDATNLIGWGARRCGGISGIYIASNDGACQIWDEEVNKESVDSHGSLLRELKSSSKILQSNILYHIGEYAPHQSLPASNNHIRQFFRLVGPEIGLWWDKHSTKNPLGVLPKASINYSSKF